MKTIPGWLLLAVSLVVAANIVAISDASKNRSGPVFQTIELTERELALQSMGQDNTGVGLILEWNRGISRGHATQFPPEKLQEAGFDLRRPANLAVKEASLLPRAAFAVLEYDGDAWREWAKNNALGAKPDNNSVQTPETSRLFPIDIGRDAIELRRRYADQSKYLIVRAVVAVRIENPVPGDSASERKYFGLITQIQPFYISVPLPYSRMLAPLRPQSGRPPRYSITLTFGSNLEPWVTSVRLN